MSASSPFEQSFSHAKAQQRSDNLPQHDDEPGPHEVGNIVVVVVVVGVAFFCLFVLFVCFLCSSNQKVINRYVLYVKHTLIT